MRKATASWQSKYFIGERDREENRTAHGALLIHGLVFVSPYPRAASAHLSAPQSFGMHTDAHIHIRDTAYQKCGPFPRLSSRLDPHPPSLAHTPISSLGSDAMGQRATLWRAIALWVLLSCCASVSAQKSKNVLGKFFDRENQQNIGEAQVTLPTSLRSGETVRISWEGVKAVTGGTSGVNEMGETEPIIESGGDSVRLFLVVSNASPQGFGVAQLPGAAEGDIIFGIQVPNVPGGNNFYDWTVPDLGGSFGNLFIAMESSPYELDLRGDDFYQIVFSNKYIVLSNEFQISDNGTQAAGWAGAEARPIGPLPSPPPFFSVPFRQPPSPTCTLRALASRSLEARISSCAGRCVRCSH